LYTRYKEPPIPEQVEERVVENCLRIVKRVCINLALYTRHKEPPIPVLKMNWNGFTK
jgi:hypothetical protein